MDNVWKEIENFLSRTNKAINKTHSPSIDILHLISELIEIPITYKGEEIVIESTLLQRGYIHGFQVMINDIPEKTFYVGVIQLQLLNQVSIIKQAGIDSYVALLISDRDTFFAEYGSKGIIY